MTNPLPLALALTLLATAAVADPCKAPVTGYKAGQTVSGTVRYVGDGDGLCVGQSRDPNSWVEIRLADFNAPELSEPGGKRAKATLQRLAKGHQAVCTATRGRTGRLTTYDRLIASCTVDGRPVAAMMRANGVTEGGR